jgi:non-ribosomal peptide synthetase component F
LRELSRREQTTLATSVLSAYIALVLRWCNETDLVVTVMTMGRPCLEVEKTIGFFASPLLLRIELLADDSFRDFLRRVTCEHGDAYEHDDSGKVATQASRPDCAWNFLFNWFPREFHTHPTALTASIENSDVAGLGDAIKLQAFPIEMESYGEIPEEDCDRSSELVLLVSDTPDGVAGTLLYRADRVTLAVIERFERNLRYFAETLVNEPDTRVSDVQLLQ